MTKTARPLQGKTAFITGASRGIGAAMAVTFARDGANVVLASKTSDPHPRLPGTIHTVAADVEAAGGKALPLMCDVRYEEEVQRCVEQAVSTFGGIDIVVNNAGAIQLTDIDNTPTKKFDLMMGINARAVFVVTKAALPHLKRSSNAHVLSLSPPISLDPRWLRGHTAYTLTKYGMSLFTLGLAEELRDDKIAVNSLWPRTIIATAAIDMLMGDEGRKRSRTAQIMADAAYQIVITEGRAWTGRCFLDEEVLGARGITDFAKYKADPSSPDEPLPDLYVGEPPAG